MSKIKKINKKLKLNYNDIEKLNDYDFILVSTSFLEFTQAYYSVIDKNPDMLKIINPILNSYSKEVITPLYIRLSVLEIKNIYRNFPKDRFWKSTFKKNIVVNISLKDAYDLLTKDIITKEEDLYLPQNRWILHSIYVSEAAKRIASVLNLDINKATILGLLHDIGRRRNHNNHPIEGYKYLNSLGFLEEAKICLTHSFIDNDITITAGGGPKNQDVYVFINSFLQNNEANIYDNIIQLCDLFCLETGFTTIEKRILDISTRKGVNDNSKEHFDKVIELKKRIEKMMNCSLYDLFPEIKKEDFENRENNYIELTNLFNSKKLIK